MEILIGLAVIILTALIFFRVIVPFLADLLGMGTTGLGIWVIVLLLGIIAMNM